jgi:hypothetical protein
MLPAGRDRFGDFEVFGVSPETARQCVYDLFLS